MSRPSAAATREQIAAVLGESVLHALGLREALLEERHALEQRDTAALAQAVAIKGDCVAKLKKLEEQRAAVCRSAGFDAGPEQMARISDWCDEDSLIDSGWRQLMEIAAECNTMNLTNGAIIRMRSQMVESNLAVLRGADPTPDTYGRAGQDGAAMHQRSLAEA